MSDKWPRQSRIEYVYYILSDDGLGRVLYDPTTELYIEGQTMDETGRWYDCPFVDVIDDGVEITRREAADIAKGLGGVV